MKLIELLSNNLVELSYEDRGYARNQQHPQGYTPNNISSTIGQGEEVYHQAKSLIENLEHLGWDWLSVYTSEDRLDHSVYIISQARMLGLWGLAISKVTEIIDQETDDVIEFGYVMGSTQYHVLEGEEAFILRFDKNTANVTYTIYSYSKPSSLLLKLGIPLLRLKQRQFVKSAVKYMMNRLE